MSDPLFISYYTREPYRAYATKKLIPSIHKFGLECDVEELEPYGDWLRDTHAKPGFILRKMEEHPDRDIIWIDADCELLKFPELLLDIPAECLMACHFSRLNPTERRELINTVIFCRRGIYTKAVVTQWLAENAVHPVERRDQVNLENVVLDVTARTFSMKRDWIYDLPPEYAWIDYAFSASYPGVKPVINHFHEARRRFLAP